MNAYLCNIDRSRRNLSNEYDENTGRRLANASDTPIPPTSPDRPSNPPPPAAPSAPQGASGREVSRDSRESPNNQLVTFNTNGPPPERAFGEGATETSDRTGKVFVSDASGVYTGDGCNRSSYQNCHQVTVQCRNSESGCSQQATPDPGTVNHFLSEYSNTPEGERSRFAFNNTAGSNSNGGEANARNSANAAEINNTNRDENQRARHVREGGPSSTEEDECRVSAKLGGSAHDFTCSGTRTLVDGAKISNQITQTVGSTATQVMGQAATMNAQQEGTQSAAMEAAASTQKTTGIMQTTMGVVNAGLGIWQIAKSVSHKRDGSRIARETVGDQARIVATKADGNDGRDTSGDGTSDSHTGWVESRERNNLADSAIKNFRLNNDYKITQNVDAATADRSNEQLRQAQITARNAQIEDKRHAVQNDVAAIGRSAAIEQRTIGNEAFTGGILSLATGIQQTTNGALNVANANQMQEAANRLRGIENNAPTATLPGANQTTGDELGTRTGNNLRTTNNAGTENRAPASTEDNQDNGTGETLGDPFNPNGLNNGPTNPGPAAGKFVGKPDGAGGGGGGGGGFSGGGTTSAAKEGAEAEPSARYADTRNSTGYESSGGGSATGSGGGGGVGADKGPDLNGMLAALLPKQGEEAKIPNGILAFGENGAAPARDNYNFLDRNAKLFDNIHNRYQFEQKVNHVGVPQTQR